MLDFVAETARGAGLEDYKVVVNVGPGRRADDLPPALAHPGRQDSGAGMNLIDRIEGELKTAMLEKDNERRDTLRLILASLRSAEKELQRPLHEDEELQVLQRERKRRVEAAEAFRDGDREEQAAKEEQELAVLEEFMPDAALRGRARGDHRRRDRRGRRDEPAAARARDGRRDAAGRGPRRRLRR